MHTHVPLLFVYIWINQIGLKFSSFSRFFLFLSLSKQQVRFSSLRSLAKSYFTGVGGQEINLCIRKRRMLVTLGKRVGLSQLSLLNSWQQSDWNVGCRVTTTRKSQVYSLELKLVMYGIAATIYPMTSPTVKYSLTLSQW